MPKHTCAIQSAVFVIASATKQSMDCRVAALLAMTKSVETGKQLMLAAGDAVTNRISNGFIVRMRRLVAAFNHFHPTFTFLNKPLLEGQPYGITRAANIWIALIQEV
jgi:hypothetical protein